MSPDVTVLKATPVSDWRKPGFALPTNYVDSRKPGF